MSEDTLFFRNRAIADYLRSNGYEEAYSVFKKEAELDVVSSSKIFHLYFKQRIHNFMALASILNMYIIYLLAHAVSELEVINSYGLSIKLKNNHWVTWRFLSKTLPFIFNNDLAGLSSVLLVTARASGQKLKHREFQLNIDNYFPVRGIEHWNRLAREVAESVPGDVGTLPGGLGQSAPADLALSSESGLGDLGRTFLTSAILWLIFRRMCLFLTHLISVSCCCVHPPLPSL